jgi:two-component system, sensor histidine kinase
VLVVVIAIASGAMSTFGAILSVYYLNFVPMLALPAIWLLAQGGLVHEVLAFLIVLWTGAILAVAHQYRKSITDSLRLRFENLDLLVDLRRQKDMAEQASIAKSRFLASASHDLRQPVHALGMFVGALRTRTLDAETARLVEYIDRSVAAMDNLFTSLLDISRLDAGIIQAHPRNVAIQPLLERICRDHAEEAARKGIGFTQIPRSGVVYSDPTLLERVLRNLLSNAVRYTDQGRVLVGCRSNGRSIRIEVWDTGRGIPIDEQEKVFQEFYQLGNAERDRSKGLGLGLAIVKRLTVLLGSPLTLRSWPGKGSMFGVAVPVAAPSAVETEAEPLLELGIGARGLVLVIDDEVAIQEAIQSLLPSWGYEVIAAGSIEEMLQYTASLTKPPDLIISDYRLRGGEDGIAAIQRLQSEFNADIPGMLITGDTAPDRLAEAQESGFVLLHKPVPNSKLRAAIGNLVRRNNVEA